MGQEDRRFRDYAAGHPLPKRSVACPFQIVARCCRNGQEQKEQRR